MSDTNTSCVAFPSPRGDTLYASNAGDSRTVSSVGGRALCLTTDHKPGDERERKRIEDAGGFVEFNRVNGNLALSRALGDFAFKVRELLSSLLITVSKRHFYRFSGQ